jgi:hypothetical protein
MLFATVAVAACCVGVSSASASLSWSGPIALDPGYGSPRFSGVACPSITQCTAVLYSGEVTFDPTSPPKSASTGVVGVPAASSVACPSTSECTVVSEYGGMATFDPTPPGIPISAWSAPGYDMFAVACPSTSQCITVGYPGLEATFNPRSTGALG